MVRFSDLLGGDYDDGDDGDDGEAKPGTPPAAAGAGPAEPRDEVDPGAEGDPGVPHAVGERVGASDGLDRFAQYAAAPRAVPDGSDPDRAALDADASAHLLASLPEIDDTFLPSRSKRH